MIEDSASTLSGSRSQDQIKRIVEKLKRFDQIAVTWLDASQCSNVLIMDKIPNHAVETKVVSDGRYLSIQKGNYYEEPHLLILKDAADDNRGNIQSIPLVLVKEIQVFDKVPLLFKKVLSSKGEHLTFRFRYPDGIVKTVRIPDASKMERIKK